MTQKQIIRKLESVKARQAKLRDQMYDLLDEVQSHCDNAEEALGDLQSANDSVSRLV